MYSYKIAVLEGDGVGPEIVGEALKVINKLSVKYNLSIKYEKLDIGGIAIDKFGIPLPEKTIEVCKNSDAVILGAVGGPKWDNLSVNLRPEAGLLGIRKSLGLFANLRHCTVFKQFADLSPIKKSVLGENLDILIIRELTGGIYFGEHGRSEENGQKIAYDVEKYSESEIVRISKLAFESARKRKKRICSVDKANVLESSKFWRECVTEVSKLYPDVELSHMYVDNCAMQLIHNPSQFDVILTSNMFGDILSDEASMLCGSIGLLPSASISDKKLGLYEPIHGSAPDIQGKNKVNPIAMILSCAMMFDYSLNLHDVAENLRYAIEKAINTAITPDISSASLKTVSCSEMGDIICSFIDI